MIFSENMNTPFFTKEQLINLSERGLIASPHESKEDFFERISSAIPQVQEHNSSNLQRIYGMSPDWVKVFYSDKNLRLWEGACTWEEEKTITIQLRKNLINKKKIWGFYSKEELLHHEMVHAIRNPLHSMIFEELLAYQTSANVFRRSLGPIIRSPNESLFYVCTWILILFLFAWPWVQLIAIICNIGLISYGIFRLLTVRKQFYRAKKNIKNMLGDMRDVLPFMIHLTDEEIIQCASIESSEIKTFFSEKEDINLHYTQICARFLR